MKILIVEDEQHIADGLRFNLEAEGFEVELAADGKIALDILTANGSRFDAIVLDLIMPVFDGLTVDRLLVYA
jgi:DNA-binding response OmpR family regulator